MKVSADTVAALCGRFEAVLPHLDERQRRLYLGAEAQALGHGGITAVATAAGVSTVTVSRGLHQLRGSPSVLARQRAPGGGRRPLTTTDPGLQAALDALIEPTELGDPASVLRRTTASLRDLAEQLTVTGHPVGATTVGKQLHRMGYSLQAAAQTRSGGNHPERDTQFRHIRTTVGAFLADGQPVISVDAKKKEAIGNYQRPGRTWRPKGTPIEVDDHAFPTDTDLITPYGIYDLDKDSGWVIVGPTATPPPSRWSRSAAGAREMDIPITVCHFPPGTAWHKQMEQGRTPAVLPDHLRLARHPADQPRGRRQSDRLGPHPHRPCRSGRAGHPPLPHRTEPHPLAGRRPPAEP